ncbi:sensor histidine kinase [Serpentinicella alkaliphila]|uniref:histidine kinase n=1 Tax=Serpentinicella alkaliphila TaxID=1734049 RepID=A0A4R2TZX1_9FIRM|nr:ATP-binding protein [Serpentinicella alkaliphila]QUH25264.1 hypothetical protein HZR23_05450 [Serpentinicella alkaliphila]TCQ07075.1 histidine kinase [Serpentinicella alkaliphila]
MLEIKEYRKISLLQGYPEFIKITFIFRYLTLLITSLFYLFGSVEHSFLRKWIIIFCISLSAIVLNLLYIKSEQSKYNTIVLILIETIGNSAILIPSGGLNSPYVWYSLNTILVAAVKLDYKVCWLNLAIYLFNSTYITNLLVNEQVNLFEAFVKESNLILSFVLITGVILLLAKYAQENEEKTNNLKIANSKLIYANHRIKESMNHIMDLYKSVELFASQENSRDLINIITEYCNKVIRTETVIFMSQTKGITPITIRSEMEQLDKKIANELQSKNICLANCETLEHIINDKRFLFVSVGNNCKNFGAIGIDLDSSLKINTEEEVVEQLKLVANLSSILFEKFELQQFAEELLINKEQNRIADEIHDGTLQRLFSTSCGIYETIKRLKKSSLIDIERDLNIIRKSLNETMRELRETVYGLSWKKNGENNFIAQILNFINDTKVLNNINIEFSLNGSDEMLSLKQKKALYRIICEGTSNAIRHAKATNIYIILTLDREYTTLEIIDNGVGFDIKRVESENKMGLGIGNIRNLVNTLRGDIYFNSSIGGGTIIEITVSNNENLLVKEEVG